MNNPIQEAQRRYLARAQGGVGGSPYAMGQARFLGESPAAANAAGLIFFDDYCQTDEANPDTKMYGASAMTADHDWPGSGDAVHKHLILKASAAFTKPRALWLPIYSELQGLAAWSALDEQTSVYVESAATVYLIKDAIDLANLTWNVEAAWTGVVGLKSLETAYASIAGAAGIFGAGAASLQSNGVSGCAHGAYWSAADSLDSDTFNGIVIVVDATTSSLPPLIPPDAHPSHAVKGAYSGTVTYYDLAELSGRPRPFLVPLEAGLTNTWSEVIWP